MRTFLRGFVYAGRGVKRCFAERNFRFHVVFACFVLYFARYFALTRAQTAVLLLTIGAVLAMEAGNTAIEALCNKVCREKDPLIAAAKDCAAGAVLLTALAAVAAGIALFWQPAVLTALLKKIFTCWWRLCLLILALVGAAAFVFLPEFRKEFLPEKYKPKK